MTICRPVYYAASKYQNSTKKLLDVLEAVELSSDERQRISSDERVWNYACGLYLYSENDGAPIGDVYHYMKAAEGYEKADEFLSTNKYMTQIAALEGTWYNEHYMDGCWITFSDGYMLVKYNFRGGDEHERDLTLYSGYLADFYDLYRTDLDDCIKYEKEKDIFTYGYADDVFRRES